mmetsp:Transcript_75871/g.181496  ORF Transcript_75871/g.181496 Transcript_75871/m.181496 type:complete len:225 (+) Transcript_75871:301-975(+)
MLTCFLPSPQLYLVMASPALLMSLSASVFFFLESSHWYFPVTVPSHFGGASVSAAMPGSTLPSKSSKEAPPPVDTKETLSSMPHLAAAVAESPPPMMPTPPEACRAATASSNALVPLEKLSNSKTPAGPFQTTVLASFTFVAKSSMLFGPQSMPSQPSGMPSSFVTSLVSWSFLNSLPHSQSTGRVTSQPFSLALSSMPCTMSAPFLSKRLLPIFMPKHTFRKV